MSRASLLQETAYGWTPLTLPCACSSTKYAMTANLSLHREATSLIS